MKSQPLKRERVADTSALPLSSQSIITKNHEGAKVTPHPPRATNKRPRLTTSSSTSQQKLPISTTTDKNVVSPVEFLRVILKDSQSPELQDLTYDGSFFSKPDEREIESYSLELVHAVRAIDIDKLREFHREGKSLNACNRFGESLLHMCCRRGDSELVKFLIQEIGVRINIKDDFGRTPLHDACWTPNPNFEIMDLILNATDPSMLLAADIRGHTPFDYARKEHWGAWVKFFEERRELLQQKHQSATSN